jgi:hypothetical protein
MSDYFQKAGSTTAGQIALVIIVVQFVVVFSAFRIGNLSTRDEHVQHGKEIERRQILGELRHGMEAYAPFYLAGMDIRFIPAPGSKDLVVRLRTSRFYRYCEGCHAI